MKNEPELMLGTEEAMPERSVAVGAAQDTVVPGVPTSTVRTMLLGQDRIVGGVVSTVKRKNSYAHLISSMV